MAERIGSHIDQAVPDGKLSIVNFGNKVLVGEVFPLMKKQEQLLLRLPDQVNLGDLIYLDIQNYQSNEWKRVCIFAIIW